MMKIARRIVVLFSFIVMLVFMVPSTVEAAARTTVYNKGEWRVYLDSPDGAKSYYHLHFYKNNKHIYCLRLDNFKICDGKDGRDKVPNKVYDAVMSHSKVQNAVKYHNPDVEDSSLLSFILKIGAVSIGVILIVISAFNVFTGPADDTLAWAYFLKALAW